MGPVTPLVAVIEKMKIIEPAAIPVWVGTRHGVERAFVENLGIEYHWLASAKLRRYFDWRSFLIPFVAAAGVVGAIWLVMKTRPKAVVGSGAYTQVPLIMVARLLGVPVIIHQQDVEVGLANQMSLFDAKAVTAAFAASLPQLGKRAVKVIGNPVRQAIVDLVDPALRAAARSRGQKRWGFDPAKQTLLVFGGGTGALGLNERLARNLNELGANANVLNIVGRGKMVETKPRAGYAVVEFLNNDEMAEAYAVADLVVCRAGMGTLTELIVLGLPAVLVPLSGHQEKNAAYLESCGAAAVVAARASEREFVDTILRLLNDRDRRLVLSRAIIELFPADAAEKLARIILENIK